MRAPKTSFFVLALALLGPAGSNLPARADPAVSAVTPSSEPSRPLAADAGAPMTEDEAAPPPEEPEAEPQAVPSPASPHGTPPPPASASERTFHVVVAGDTLGGIALKYGVTVAALAAQNGMTRGSPIRIGQRLEVPAPGETVRVPTRVHVVARGNTLGSIARSYGVTVEALRKANRLPHGARLSIGEKLVIPGDTAVPAAPPEKDEPPPARENLAMQTLAVPGTAPAYYFEPAGPGHNSMRPVIVYLHGRGAEPARYCQRWARVARHLGWLVCPSGPEDRGDGKRGWANNWVAGRRIVLDVIEGLRKKYGRRVQLWGNTLIGFSEGAFVAMNVGLREPHTFNRWLILGADTDYWGAAGLASLPEAKGRVRRVYLITGRHDEVYGDADEVRRWLVRAGVPVRVSTPKDMGHEVALESKPAMYQAALRWLAEG
jgi:LysM repeat protein/predicted esterase